MATVDVAAPDRGSAARLIPHHRRRDLRDETTNPLCAWRRILPQSRGRSRIVNLSVRVPSRPVDVESAAIRRRVHDVRDGRERATKVLCEMRDICETKRRYYIRGIENGAISGLGRIGAGGGLARDFSNQNLTVHLGLGRASWHGTQ